MFLDEAETQLAVSALEQELKDCIYPVLEDFFADHMVGDELPVDCLRIFIMTLSKMMYDSFYASSSEVLPSKQKEFRALIQEMLVKMMTESDDENVYLYLPKERWSACFQKSQSQTLDE